MKKSKEPPTLAEIYAELILSELPPKQSQKQRAAILKACQLLQKESELAAKHETFMRLELMLEHFPRKQNDD